MAALLNRWLSDFKGRFGRYPEAQSTIARVEEALALYQERVVAVNYRVEIARAIEDRSVLEYGLDYHLPRFLDAVSTSSLIA